MCPHEEDRTPLFVMSLVSVLGISEVQSGGPQTLCWCAEWSGTLGTMGVRWRQREVKVW